MKELEELVGKKMPYSESGTYVAQLIEECADKAVADAGMYKRKNTVRLVRGLCSVAAMLLVAVTLYIGLNQESPYEKIQNSKSLAEVINSMSEEQLMCVNYYEVEDIPEY